MKYRFIRVFTLIALLSMLVSFVNTSVSVQANPTKVRQALSGFDIANADSSAMQQKQASHRLIVELASPSLSQRHQEQRASGAATKLRVESAESAAYINQLRAEQAAFVNTMQSALPDSKVSTFINEQGLRETASYQIVFNGMAIDPGKADRDTARATLAALPGVKHVYLDYAHTADLYSSNELINSPALWNHPTVSGRSNAGEGIKFASVDGGVHKDAPMFSGAGYSYPPGYPANGLGLTENNNGKIIVSRAYFRDWDPPIPGDDNPWPGIAGTSHGVHTSGIAAGNVVTATYQGLVLPNMSGVAPRAWVMSYRVFYESMTGDGSFYNAEGIAALEDVAADRADVVNNSWGGGPGSSGGEYDALDQALINLSAANVFVSMSAGNAGPGFGTTDHPSDDYINVAATTTSGTLSTGRVNVTAPQPVPATLQNMIFGIATFGAPLTTGVVSHPFVVPTTNTDGCATGVWSATEFTGKAVLIERGVCEFGVKVLNAENAGAAFVIIYNNAANGDVIGNMGPGAVGAQVTISSILIGRTNGVALVDWYTQHGAASTLEVDTMVAFNSGNIPDRLAGFSSRGPGAGNVLKPDIAAPGVNILSQGYTNGATGEARHLGYGQVSGTSMAAPHVAGAAVLLRQIHPSWTNEEIKSALMTTAKYTDVFTLSGAPAQPLDMGAGRMDLTKAANPGVIVSPASLSFGRVISSTTKSIQVTVRSVGSSTDTYNLSMIYTGGGFNAITSLPGYSVSPASITLAPGASATVTVTFNPAQGGGYGDKQGYLVLDGAVYDAHMAAWARVSYAQNLKDVLIIDNDGSSVPALQTSDYLAYYTDALTELGYNYDIWDANLSNGTTSIPEAFTLDAYDVVLYFTGDNATPDGFTVATGLTLLDMDRLTEYANGGGQVIAMGQDMAAVLGAANDSPPFFYGAVLGATWLQDSVTDGLTPTLPIIPADNAPDFFQDVVLDITADGDGAGNQLWIDELETPRRLGDPDNTAPLVDLVPLLKYPGPFNQDRGVVTLAHRDQPSLERAGTTYPGSSIYATFGLEGVNDTATTTSRAELLGKFLDWGMATGSVVISDTTTPNASNLTRFRANFTSNISGTVGYSYRWDFGDGSGFTSNYPQPFVSHTYEQCGTYMVRVEVTDSLGNITLGSLMANVSEQCTSTSREIYLPIILR